MSALAPEHLAKLKAWLSGEWGLKGEDYRDAFLDRRVAPRLAARACPDPGSYLRLLENDPAEAKVLLAKLLVPTTEFMRNPEVFAALARALQERMGRRGWSPLRLLSAPCSTGEEAVSLAILLEEKGMEGRIVAADRSAPALARLASGIFGLRALEKLDSGLKERYFTVEGDRAMVAPGLRRRIFPVRLDMGWGLGGRRFHAVIMRNLFIYLTEAAQGRLLEEAGRALEPGGLLVLGRVETVGRRWRGSWRPVDADCRIYEWTGVRA